MFAFLCSVVIVYAEPSIFDSNLVSADGADSPNEVDDALELVGKVSDFIQCAYDFLGNINIDTVMFEDFNAKFDSFQNSSVDCNKTDDNEARRK